MPLFSRFIRTRILSRSVIISVFLFITLCSSYIFFFSHYSSKQQNPLISKKTLIDKKDDYAEHSVKFENTTPKITNENIFSEEIKNTDSTTTVKLYFQDLSPVSFNTNKNLTRKTVGNIVQENEAKVDNVPEVMLTLNLATNDQFEDDDSNNVKGITSAKEKSNSEIIFTSLEGFDSREFSTPSPDDSVLLYNRVPKCGSSALIALIIKLGKQNGFRHWSSRHYWARRVPGELGQKSFLRSFMVKEKPFSMDRHIYFVNFSKFGYDNIYYINLIRDPVERIISDFHYLRAAKRWTGTTSTMPPQSWFKKNFSECVLRNDPECRFSPGSYVDLPIAYFCGHKKECMKLNSRWALQKAKANVEKFYTVVGILEDLETMVRLAEKLLPRFFKGALEIFHKTDLKKNRNPKKPKVSEKVRNILKNKLYLEYEFYNFIKQRIAKQKKTLNL